MAVAALMLLARSGQGPSGGRCSVSPPVGDASTPFSISCRGVTDVASNLPILYTFFDVGSSGLVALSDAIPVATLTCRLRVPVAAAGQSSVFPRSLTVKVTNAIGYSSAYSASVILTGTPQNQVQH